MADQAFSGMTAASSLGAADKIPIVQAGANKTITAALANLSTIAAGVVANRVFAGPATGADAPGTFRALVAADIPTDLNATIVAGTLTVRRGIGGTWVNLADTIGTSVYQIYHGAAGNMHFFRSTVPTGDTLVLDSTGRVLVNTSTVPGGGPDGKLITLGSKIRNVTFGYVTGMSVVGDNSSVAAGIGGAIAFISKYVDSPATYWNIAQIVSEKVDGAANSAGNLFLEVSDSTFNLRKVVAVTSLRNVGINTVDQFGTGQGVLGIANAAAVPSTNPTGGCVTYAEAGAFKARGSSGTITTMAAAEPHCPVCGKDFIHEWENEEYGYLAVCMACLADELGVRPWIMRRKG